MGSPGIEENANHVESHFFGEMSSGNGESKEEGVGLRSFLYNKVVSSFLVAEEDDSEIGMSGRRGENEGGEEGSLGCGAKNRRCEGKGSMNAILE